MLIADEKFITLASRGDVPSARIFTKQYVQDKLGARNTVILLPGGPGNDMSMYDDEAMSIAQTFFQAADVILFDPRNCGKSALCDLKYSALDHYIDDVEALRQYFALSADKFFVFGQSYGSIAALGYAIRYPDSLKKLLLIGGAVSSSFIDEAKHKLKEIGTPEQIAFAEKLWHGTFDGSKKEIVDFYRLLSPLYAYSFEPSEPPLEIGYNIDVMNSGWGGFLHNFDYTDRLAEIKCTTMILWGADEWIMPRSQIDTLHASIRNCTLRIYPQCMHMLWIDQWLMFKRDSVEFLLG